MRLFGLNISRVQKAAGSYLPSERGWFGIVRESFPGAWQQNVEITTDEVLGHPTAQRCISLISSDIAKMRVKLIKRPEDDPAGIWREVSNPAYSPVLNKPNRFQNRIQFFVNWMESKLVHGNSYALKERDNRNVVVRLYILDPHRVRPLVTPDGSVYYDLGADNLSGISGDVVVPASEIIHDRWNTVRHPLVGMSPISACGLAAIQGLRIQRNSASFFANNSQPGALLVAPGELTQDRAVAFKRRWEEEFSGDNAGRVAVLGGGLTYQPLTMSAQDSQLIEQLRWSAETVAGVFGVPAYKVGIGEPPNFNNVEALNSQYYSQCLQIHIESIELGLDEGLELRPGYGTQFDLDGLLRMDTMTKVEACEKAVRAGIFAPDEARAKFDLPPVEGGDSPYLQVQNYSLAALARRDEESPPVTPGLPVQQTPARRPVNGENAEPEEEEERALPPAVLHAHLVKAIEHAAQRFS